MGAMKKASKIGLTSHKDATDTTALIKGDEHAKIKKPP
jgi:hypothetical protein